MRLYYLQHVPFERPENIEVWAKQKGHTITGTLVDDQAEFPSQDDFDWLVIMGGPMGVYEEDMYPWLSREKQFIKETIDQKKLVLGICLGSQLIAEVLGGRVYKNKYKEIGWFPITLTEEAKGSPIFGGLPEKFVAFHWHGDTYDLGQDCVWIASSEGCVNQAFAYQNHVVGLQFHLESTDASIRTLIDHCGDELVADKYIEQPDEILQQNSHLKQMKHILFTLLDDMESKVTHQSAEK